MAPSRPLLARRASRIFSLRHPMCGYVINVLMLDAVNDLLKVRSTGDMDRYLRGRVFARFRSFTLLNHLTGQMAGTDTSLQMDTHFLAQTQIGVSLIT
ncbi:hypothetical protein FRC02_000428, partial [Tulasnella sp. 418]